ncbi:SDR family NAD(P)-dependent oxidoreductase [Flavobacterium piscinae]|uniref:SDR family NAD(P)-dependent oxidoreductase n=1 Tax=Flavobacterium piscinae TaxID=2506424 RepID=UPI002AAAE0F0|nr:SDR family NAD(P)-dependent oxidoreductase [Flavobacterium piscinae]
MKNIVLIGGSYGIGKAIAQLMQFDCNLYIAARTNEQITNLRVNYIPFDASTDVLDNAQLPAVIDGLVFCPGSINLRPFKGIKPETFESDLQVNFINMVKVIQTVLPQLTASEQASIVLFSSVANEYGNAISHQCCRAKGAIEGFAKALATEYAPKIRVNVIAPSLTDTPLADKFLNNEVKKRKIGRTSSLKALRSTGRFSTNGRIFIE